MRITHCILVAAMLLTTTAFALDPVTRPLRTKVEKLPPAETIKVAAKQVEAMKKLESKAWTVPGLNLKMVKLPAGAFTMGSPKNEDSRKDDETQHKVTISKPFYMGIYEVRQEAYYRLLKADFNFERWRHWRGSLADGMALQFRNKIVAGGDNGYELLLDNPMECISFVDAVTFCKAINERESKAGRIPDGYEYRLPTEAEWEYACRAGTKVMFALGDAKQIIAEGKLLKTKQSANRELRSFAGCGEVSSVGQDRKPNAWGLYDMHGNVAEWCLDSYAPYTPGKAADPLVINDTPEKVIRGGSAYAGSEFMRSAARYHIPFDINYYPFVGMRLVLAPRVAFPMPEKAVKTQSASR
jgi:formylglycine-generating enzyme required for sulfatase activity